MTVKTYSNPETPKQAAMRSLFLTRPALVDAAWDRIVSAAYQLNRENLDG